MKVRSVKRTMWLLFGVFLLVVAWTLDCNPANAQPYPRIGAYVGVRSGGSPLIRPDFSVDSAMCQKLARFPRVAIDLNALLISPAIMSTLTYYRPGIEVSGYHLTNNWYLPDTFVVRQTDKTFDASWHNALVGTKGLLRGVPKGLEVNTGQKLTSDSLASLLVAGLKKAGVKAFFGDFFNPLASWDGVGNEFSDAVRVQNAIALVRRVRESLPVGFRLYGNGTGAERCGLDGTMVEGFPFTLGPFSKAIQQRDGDWLKAEHTVGTTGDPRAVRFLLGTACLTGATATYGSQVVSSPWQAELWFPEYAVDPQGKPDASGRYVGWLGYPTSLPTKLASGLWVRFFEHGVVLVNPTAVGISLDMVNPRYKKIGSTTLERVVNVGPQDALLMWASE